MKTYIFDNSSTGKEELKNIFARCLPTILTNTERQLILALTDCLHGFCQFNLTKNILIGYPLQFENGNAYFPELSPHTSASYLYTDFIQDLSINYSKTDRESFLSNADPDHLKSCFRDGIHHITNTYLFSSDETAEGTIKEQHILLYTEDENGDLLGLAYSIDVLKKPTILEDKERQMLSYEEDTLTGCYNRSTLARIVPAYLENQSARCTFITLDVDNFKKANDIGGHQFGDSVLSDVARILRESFRKEDLIVRLGGDEFAVFVKEDNDRERIRSRVQQLIKKAEHKYLTEEGNVFHSSISVGIALYPECGTSLDELYRNADEALYRAKALGKNGYSFYKEIAEGKALNEIFKKGFRDSDCRDILDSLIYTAIFVVEEATHRILFYNRHVKDVFPNITIGAVCSDLGMGDCRNCPLRSMEDAAFSRINHWNSSFGEDCEFSATRMLWQGKTPAVILRVWPKYQYVVNKAKVLPVQYLQTDAEYDSITGGRSRRGFISTMEKMRACGTDLTDYAILFINIKGFKAVNDLFGADGGDELLRAAFSRISKSTLSPVVCARKESDHFVFLVERSDLDYKELRSLLEFRWKFNAQEITVHCRCGIYNIDNSSRPIPSMIDSAKLAKEHITDEFLEPYCVFENSMRDNYVDQMLILSLFDAALERGEFEVYYQPIYSIELGKIVGAEALVRWNSTEHGFLNPGQFLSILEQYGYITKLDEYVFDEVCSFQREWQLAARPLIPISVNLSRMDFLDQKLLLHIENRLKSGNIPQGAVNFEITESIRGESAEQNSKRKFIELIRACGSKIYLDDFGVGYSAFDMIENYDFDIVKIDKSFVQRLIDEPKVKTIVRTIIYMCHNLEIRVVAEGVEKKEAVDLLKELDCDYVQGYYYMKPMTKADFKKII